MMDFEIFELLTTGIIKYKDQNPDYFRGILQLTFSCINANIEVSIRILSGISNLNILPDAGSKRVCAGIWNQILQIFQYIYIIPLKQRLSNMDIIGYHCHFKMVVVIIVILNSLNKEQKKMTSKSHYGLKTAMIF